MNHLLREIAPMADVAWAAVDEEASEAAKATLAGRRFVDFTGPLGWEAHAIDLGEVDDVGDPPFANVRARQRRALALVELRASFRVPREKLDALARGAKQTDLDEVAEAARKIALAEDAIIFDGLSSAGVEGILGASPHDPVALEADYERYPNAVAEAIVCLREAGVDGPFGIALGSRCHTGLTTTTSGGYPVMEHVRRILDGPMVWAPGIDGACVLSMRGGDHELIIGQDLSVGFESADGDAVHLYLEESMTFRNLEPGAAVPLRYGSEAEDA